MTNTAAATAPLPPIATARINDFCRVNRLTIAENPCVSPDFCLDWPALSFRLKAEHSPMATLTLKTHHRSGFSIAAGAVTLVEDERGDHAWVVKGPGADGALLDSGVALGPAAMGYAATWGNLLRLKDLVLRHDPAATIFPTAAPALMKTSIGVGARFTTLHWPAVEWAIGCRGGV